MPGIVARVGGQPPQPAEIDRILSPLHHFDFYTSGGEACPRGWLGWVGVGQNDRRLSQDQAGRHLVAYHGDGAERCEEPQRRARTEDIANLIGTDPSALASRLGGTFAAATLDRETGEFHCITDRFGQQRVYYRQVGDTLYLVCELKALFGWPEFPLESDPAALRDQINYGYPLGDRTSLVDVKLLPPRSHLTFRDGKLTVERYWSPRYEPQEGDDDALCAEAHRLFTENFAAKTAGADQLILPVSGGLDSRLLLGEALAQKKELVTYTYGHRRSHEVAVARDLMQTMGVDPRHIPTDEFPDPADAIRRTTWFSEGMVNATIAHLAVVLTNFMQEPRSALFVNGIYGGPTNFSAAYQKPDEMTTDYTREQKVDRIGMTMFSRRLHTAANYRKLTPEFGRVCDQSYDREIDDLLDDYTDVSPLFGHQKDAFYIDNRLCRFMNQVDLNRYYWDEVIPLTSTDLYDFYLRLPDRLKFGRKLHRQMLVKYYPKAADVKVSGIRITVREEMAGKAPNPPGTRTARVQHLLRRLTAGRYNPADPRNFRSHDYTYRRNRPLREFYEKVLGQDQLLAADYFNTDVVKEYLVRVRRGAQLLTPLAEIMAWEMWERQLRARRWDV